MSQRRTAERHCAYVGCRNNATLDGTSDSDQGLSDADIETAFAAAGWIGNYCPDHRNHAR